MKVMLVTDVEGVAGVLNFEEYCSPGTPYYEKAKRLLTEETNAVIRGMFDGGVDEILVVDGHGPGAIDPELLDSRAELLRGAPRPNAWPFTLDSSFDGIGWVGQHAKSRTPYSHLTHTGTFAVYEVTANGIPVGEFGYLAMCAGELGVPVVFAGGEEAFAREAEELAPGVVTVGVKRGCNTEDDLDEASEEVYKKSKLSAIHLAPEKARQKLYAGALEAAKRLKNDPESFTAVTVEPPYEIKSVFRKCEVFPEGATLYRRHDTSFIAAMNSPHTDK